jgi:hypothetical protein
VRENMGIRYMIKPRQSTWKMLADGASLPAFIKGIKGRAHVVIDGHAEEVQGAYLTEDEMRAMATAGKVCPVPDELAAVEKGAVVMLSGQSGPIETDSQLEQSPDTLAGVLADTPADTQPDTPEPVWLTIEEAVSAGILQGSAESVKRVLRRYAQNSRDVPEPSIIGGARKYDRNVLIAWQDSRPVQLSKEPDMDEAGAS